MERAVKIAKATGNVLLYAVVVVAVLLLIFYVFAGTGKPMPGGIRPMIVLTGSMEPKLPVGSIIVAKNVDPASVKIGDIVTFTRTDHSQQGSSVLVTHRVEEVVSGDVALSFITKGDANGAPDGTPVLASQIVGRVFLVVPYAGHITRFVRTPLGLILFILLPAAVLIGLELRSLLKRKSKPLQGGGVLVLVFALVATGSVMIGQASASSAYFNSQNELSAGLSSGAWDTQHEAELSFAPGTAKAVRPSEVPPGPANFTIASIDETTKEMKLDFGEVHPGNTNNSPDVFRIKNEGDEPVEINIVGVEGFEDFIVRVGQGSHVMPVTLQPGEEYSVDIKIGVAHNKPAGDYTGVVRVLVAGVSTTWNIPALITVVDSGNGPEKNGKSEDELGNGKSLKGLTDPSGATDQEGDTTTTTAVGAPSDQQSDDGAGGDQSTTTTTTLGGSDPNGQLSPTDQEDPPEQI